MLDSANTNFEVVMCSKIKKSKVEAIATAEGN